MKMCGCGCGKPTNIAKRTEPSYGAVKGRPYDYLQGHRMRLRGGKTHILGTAPDGTRRAQHILIVEEILGKPLPPRAHIHHLNGNKRDNRHSNLVVCEDAAYHYLLHQRQRSLAECGHADWRPCSFCKRYDEPTNLVEHGRRGKNGRSGRCHVSCRQDYMREWHATQNKGE